MPCNNYKANEMVQRKLKCRDSDYEYMKEVRWRFSRTCQEIETLEKDMAELRKEEPPNEFGMQLRQEELRDLNRRKKVFSLPFK